MKKYKLIKEYPGSPELGFEVTFKEGYPFVYKNTYNFSLEICKNNAEFWEEIIEEKDYEILSFIHKDMSIIFNKNSKGRYSSEEKYTGSKLETILDSQPWLTIHSICRKSDGEVFTLGDKIKGVFGKDYIKSFDIVEEENSIRIWLKNNTGGLLLKFHPTVNLLSKEKEPLFTTEDNYDILDKEELVYLVNPKTCAVTRITFNCWDKTRLLFKTKEGLDEWMLWNKPVLSMRDVMMVHEEVQGDWNEEEFIETLKHQVLDKL